jgi:NADH-quinone oxidoreductase subunit L
MWIATLAIAGIPPFAGFFSKDEILGTVFARAHAGPLSTGSLLGVPGHVVLLTVYVIGLASALLTAIYMTRMMIYTFHGPNRTGDAEQAHLAEAPWIMTGPLVVLGVLSAFGGWLNLPELLPMGPIGVLEHWLEPVVGAATTRMAGAGEHVAVNTEWVLIGVAVAIAVVGMSIAFARLKPAALVLKSASPASEGFAKVLEHKYYVDEFYDDAVVQPVKGISTTVLWKGVDAGIIDGLLVNGSAALARAMGWLGAQLQSGQVGTYAWVLVIGVLALLGAFTSGR